MGRAASGEVVQEAAAGALPRAGFPAGRPRPAPPGPPSGVGCVRGRLGVLQPDSPACPCLPGLGAMVPGTGRRPGPFSPVGGRPSRPA